MNYKQFQLMRKQAGVMDKAYDMALKHAPDIAAIGATAGGVALAHNGLSRISWLQKRKRLLGALEILTGIGAGVGTRKLVSDYGPYSIKEDAINSLERSNYTD